MFDRNKTLLFGLLFLLHSVSTSDNSGEDYILCRRCGFKMSPATLVVNMRSPAAEERFNQTLFGIDNVEIQKIKNPIGLEFDIVITRGATCVARRERWNSRHSWFPGYVWKSCLCSHCATHVGWLFEPLSSANEDRLYVSSKGFYALILDTVVSEKYDEKAFLAQCEMDFSDRYTDKDFDYSIHLQIGMSSPPCVEPWYPKIEPPRDRKRTDNYKRENNGESSSRNDYQRKRTGYNH